MNEFIQITTIDEVLYYLASKEIVVFNLINGQGYLEQVGNKFYICIQPKFGSSSIAEGNRGLMRKTFNKFHDTDFYVLPGLRPLMARSTVFDRVADFFKGK